jgi:hypothetical protein
VSNLSQPLWRGDYDTVYDARGIFVSGSLAYVADTEGGLWILQYTGDPPMVPSNLRARAVSGYQINLTWRDNSSNEQGFKIQRKASASGTWAQIATVGPGVTVYQNKGLSLNRTYYYRVCAYNASGDSAWSNEASATTRATGVSRSRWELFR